MSGGGGTHSATTSTSAPPWLNAAQRKFVGDVGAFVNQDLAGGYPQGLNQQVAPFSGFQNTALSNIGALTPLAQTYAQQGANTNALYASGGMLGPNPYLNQYYNQAATQDVNQYKFASQPSLQAQFQQAGAFNSPGFREAQGQLQYGLGQSLGTLGANIYEPAYQFESGQRLNAAQNMPGAVAGLYQPQQTLYGAGSAQQQQYQNQLNANRTNTAQQLNYPFAILSQLGSALGQGALGGGTTTTTGPASGGGLFGK